MRHVILRSIRGLLLALAACAIWQTASVSQAEWHGTWYNPPGVVVPPTAGWQTHWGPTVSSTRVSRIPWQAEGHATRYPRRRAPVYDLSPTLPGSAYFYVRGPW